MITLNQQIKLNLNGTQVVLTKDEADALYALLKDALGKQDYNFNPYNPFKPDLYGTRIRDNHIFNRDKISVSIEDK